MAVTDGLRAQLRAVTPATSGRLDESGFLLAGATAGLLGWVGTQALSWFAVPDSALLATALWVVLVAGFSGVTVLHAPDDVRFSTPMLGWGTVNSAAMALTAGGVVGVVPPQAAFWTAWVVAMGLGYLWTGGLLARASATSRGRGYLAAGGIAGAVLALGTVAFDIVAPVAFLVLAAIHAVPLVLDAKTTLSPVASAAILALIVGGLLGTAAVV